jgi:hypothetical protein
MSDQCGCGARRPTVEHLAVCLQVLPAIRAWARRQKKTGADQTRVGRNPTPPEQPLLIPRDAQEGVAPSRRPSARRPR